MQEDTPLDPVNSVAIKCITCGYDLSGSALGGVCPECGTPVSDSIRASNNAQAGGNSTTATISMVLGIVGISACGLVAPFAIWLYYRAKDEVARGVAPPSSMGMAKAGLVLGWIGTVLTLLVCGFYGILFAVDF